MRIVPLAVAFFCCAAAGAAEPKRDREQDKSLYVIECRLTTTTEAGKRTVLMAPTISVNEGVPATIKDVTQTPFATGIVSHAGRDESRVTVLEEGTTIELTVFGDRRGWVTVDANIQTSQVTGVETKEVRRNDPRQCPQTDSRTVRIIQVVKMGEVLAVEAKAPEGAPQRTIELVVRSASANRHQEVPTEHAVELDIPASPAERLKAAEADIELLFDANEVLIRSLQDLGKEVSPGDHCAVLRAAIDNLRRLTVLRRDRQNAERNARRFWGDSTEGSREKVADKTSAGIENDSASE